MFNKVGFEYNNTKGETAFETFLRYSDEKEKSSTVLARVLDHLLIREGMAFLDVGSGNGEYLKLSLNKIKHPRKTRLTLLEPSKDLVKRLRTTANQFPGNPLIKVVNSVFEEFVTKDQFDVILISHVPLAKDQADRLPGIYRKMIGLLKSQGSLIVVLRGKDDIHEFRTLFKSRLIGVNHQSITIDDSVEVLENIAKDTPLHISRHSARARLRMPYPDNMRDVISIVEFFLNKRWDEFPGSVRENVMDYIRQKHGVLKHTDGFAVVRKACSRNFAP